ncbi:hypothetical protein CEXT_65631 [Caerostris extrusa]|uniref:Uncharacterized protein n=1 Tax=Caerostris extrusa TaxID=172846 RepID=A0AAV4NYN8_CAEEX|nr:hypothetical protein CEXT_65631 [Caerostris extrusa]
MADCSRDSGRFVPEFYCSWLRISFEKKRLEAELVTPEAMNFSYGLLQNPRFPNTTPTPATRGPRRMLKEQGEEAAARGRQCLRKCASDADCISTRKRCLCDGLCGWSCIRPAPSFLKTPRATEGNFTSDFREHFRIVRIA